MDERKKQVLKALVDDYIVTAEPVGSRSLAKRYDFGVGSATIRNEMADLEEMGYLEQPHTSAGRVPSDKGYRFYVDRLMDRPVLDAAVLALIRSTYRAQVREIQWFIHQTARLVSQITAYPSVVVAPPLTGVRLGELRLLPLGDDTALLILQTDAGIVESRTVVVPDGLTPQELAGMARDFTQAFRGTPIQDLEGIAGRHIAHQIKRYQTLWEDFLLWLSEDTAEDEKMSLGGALNLLDYPEFRDVQAVRRVLGFLETEANVDHLLSRRVGAGIQVLIGAELSPAAIADCSVVTATYEMGKKVVGKLLVLGPRRMQYGQVITVLEAVSEELSRVLNWA